MSRPRTPYKAALVYHNEHGGTGICIYRGGVRVLAVGADTRRDLESGSKSFCGLIAEQLKADGMIASLDDAVASVITEWAGRDCTIRRLLSQTSGLAPGATGSKPTYEQAIAAPMPSDQVGSFRYGPNSYGVFGMLVNRLVQPLGYADGFEYLAKRVLGPIGVTASCDRIAPGQPNLAGGVHMTAREWAKFGEWLRLNIPAELIASQTVPPDPLYGVSFWLCMDNDRTRPIPANGFVAAGAHNQRMAVLRDDAVVCARQGTADTTWNDGDFMSKLRAG